MINKIMCFSKKCPRIPFLKIMEKIPENFVIRCFYECSDAAVWSIALSNKTLGDGGYVLPQSWDRDNVIYVHSWRDIKRFIKENCVAGQEEKSHTVGEDSETD